MRQTTPAWLAVMALSCQRGEPPAIPSPHDVQAVLVKGELPRVDPFSRAWDQAPEHVATLMMQEMTEPSLTTPSIEILRVRALHDGSSIVFRLEWNDRTQDTWARPAAFSDAVAVQLPYETGGDVPDAAMGETGRPVRIHVWKASLEARLASKGDVVSALYPNMASDHYPAESTAEDKRPAMEALYAPARALGNPVTIGRPDAPVQDLVAEGFGTLTALPEQVSRGKGVYDKGRWRVTIARPLDADDKGALRSGKRTYAAFALWDGSSGNVGSRKMMSGWIPLALGPLS